MHIMKKAFLFIPFLFLFFGCPNQTIITEKPSTAVGYFLNTSEKSVKSDFTGKFLSVNCDDSVSADVAESREVYSEYAKIENHVLINGEKYHENEIPSFIRNPFGDSELNFLDRKSDEIQSDFSLARSAESGEKTYPNKKQFYYFPDSSKKVAVCTAALKSQGKHCLVYYYNNVNDRKYGGKFIDPTDKEFQGLADFFDGIYEKETNLLGGTEITNTHDDKYITTTGEDKILIFVYDLQGDAEKDSDGGTYGYFYASDLYSRNYRDNFGRLASFNEAEMFYVDSDFLKKYPKSIYSTLAHEFAHLLDYVNKVINTTRTDNMEKTWSENIWFSEMLAMNAEDAIIGKSEGSEHWVANMRIPFFICNYRKGFLNWNFTDDQSLEEQLAIYGNTYAFGAYLIRNYGGINLLHGIATNDLYGKGAITQALHDCGYENESFNSVLRKFPLVIANVEKNKKGFISLNNTVPSTKIGNFSYDVSEINIFDYGYRAANSNVVRGPVYATRGKSYNIDAWGFVVYKLGESIDYDLPTNEEICAYYYSKIENQLIDLRKS